MSENRPQDIRYWVLKLDELLAVCTQPELQKFETIVDRILRKREEEGKPAVNSYIVINSDEPYADEVKEILKRYEHWD